MKCKEEKKMPRKPSLDGKDSSLRIRMSPEQKEKLVSYAERHYQMINPINRSLNRKQVLKYKVEPYVIAADIYFASSFLGHGGWTWYTGSSGWFYNTGVRDILGIQKHGDVSYSVLRYHSRYN